MELIYKSVDKKTIDEFKSSLLSMSESHGVFDSHPALKTRIEYAKKFSEGEEQDRRAARELFDNWNEINEKVAGLYNLRLLYYLQALSSQSETTGDKQEKNDKQK